MTVIGRKGLQGLGERRERWGHGVGNRGGDLIERAEFRVTGCDWDFWLNLSSVRKQVKGIAQKNVRLAFGPRWGPYPMLLKLL